MKKPLKASGSVFLFVMAAGHIHADTILLIEGVNANSVTVFASVCSVGAHSPLYASLDKTAHSNTLSHQQRSDVNAPCWEKTLITAGNVCRKHHLQIQL